MGAMELVLIGSNVIMFLVFLFRYATLPPQIPLFYVHQKGEDQLGEWWMIFLLPILLDVFFVFNRQIIRMFFHNNPFVSKVVYYVNLFLIISFTVIFIQIVLLIS